MLCFFISIFLLSTFDGRLLAGKEELKCGVLTHDMSAPGIEREGNKIRVYSSIIKKDLRIWADIPESFRQDIELKWYNISLREGIRYVDKNDNGLIDRLEWVLDELKGQEEFEINISPKEDVRRIVLKTTADFDEIKQTGLSNFVYSDYLNAYIGLVENRNIKNLANLKDVRIELDEAMHIMLQDTLPLIGADIVHKKVIDGQNLTGQNISVCVIDTGVYPHPDFANRIIAQHCFADDSIPGNGVGYCPNGQEEDENATDDNGHGTRVAGIVAANGGIKGVAPAASIVAVKVCNSGGQCYTSDIAKGIEWCRQHKDEYNIDIITISLGTWDVYPDRESCAASTNTTITPAVDAAHADGIFIDAASGNSYSINGLSNPACLANVTSVAASYKDDAVTYYSNVHPTMLDIVAPGHAINSTKMPNTYGTGSGTSFAAPHIAGVAAILQQQSRLMNNRTLTPDELRDLLNKTGKPVPDNYSMARTGLM
ncbi:MAG: S8 family serine peptidase, partial [Candidatus Aenigmatarchaeota archaeon]